MSDAFLLTQQHPFACIINVLDMTSSSELQHVANVYNEPISSGASPCYSDVKIPLETSALQADLLDQMMKPSVLSSPEQDVMQHRPHFQKRASHTVLFCKSKQKDFH